MKEDITRRTMQCQSCGQYYVPLDDLGICEVCIPQTLYARGAGYFHHPYQPDLSDVGDLGDCEDE